MNDEPQVNEQTLEEAYDGLADRAAMARAEALRGNREEAIQILQEASLEYLKIRDILVSHPGFDTLEDYFRHIALALSSEQRQEEDIEPIFKLRHWKGHTQQHTYTVLYEQGPTSWGAYVPDLDGCIATGKTRQEVERRIREALEIHIRGMVRSGEEVPPPTIFPGQVTLQVPVASAEDQIAA